MTPPPRHTLVHGDGIRWLSDGPAESIHAIVTDPPYGVREYEGAHVEKLRAGRGGVWREPPTLGGCRRAPLPRFTEFTAADLGALRAFFATFATAAMRALAPGGHIILACNPLLSHEVWAPLCAAGFEKRGEIVRLVQTLRGGDRPKGAEEAFPDVSVMPRSAWEPWGVFRKPFEGRVEDALRRWGTGGLRRESEGRPFTDVIRSAPTGKRERALSPHPSLKPQAFMRTVVRASLPLGVGVVVDPFMGGGSTIAAARAVGYESVGIERDETYFAGATLGIPKLAALVIAG